MTTLTSPAKPSLSPRWMSWVLYLSAAYNIAWGSVVVLFPLPLFALAGMEPPRYPELFQCIGMMVAVFGVAYLAAARDPLRFWPVVLAGFLGRFLGPLGFIAGAIKGTFPWVAGLTIVTNDLIWLVPFALILWRAYRSR